MKKIIYFPNFIYSSVNENVYRTNYVRKKIVNYIKETNYFLDDVQTLRIYVSP